MKSALIASATALSLVLATPALAEGGCSFAKPQHTAQMSKPEAVAEAQVSTPSTGPAQLADVPAEPKPVETAAAASGQPVVKPN